MTSSTTSTWLDIPPQAAGFGPGNLPFGVFARAGAPPRVGVAIGEMVLDLAGALGEQIFDAPSLNPFLALGHTAWQSVRRRVRELLTDSRHRDDVLPQLIPMREVELRLPIEVADFVDFYASIEHATNAGRILRPDQEPLRRNWRHLPVGYHARAGTVVVSGTPITRPRGLTLPGPEYRPTEKLDFEAEVGFVVGGGSMPGVPVPIGDFAEHVFGVVLLIDWSARDVQSFEAQPLGPFLAKSFATSISPWVVPLDALDAARLPHPGQHPAPAAHLAPAQDWALDLHIEALLDDEVVSRPPFRTMYWTADQQLAHLTSNGAHLRPGDLYGSGTVSGPDDFGSLLELTWDGQRALAGGHKGYLADGQRVTLRATAPGPDGTPLSFGEVTGVISPAR